ncbi:MAG: prepilin-type N-terminal cleavage/methylation domain-containing protein [Patescibacteria group bacterium]|nr:MAG: prepilin-type N-terminal cleavage/methylation domain-containing protein [Patescibacteria group bacterium]
MIYRQNKKAFTLIELLVVIAIIGVLSTLVIVALGNSRSSARDAKRLNDLKAMANALELYYANNNQYPASITPGQPLEAGGIVYMSKVPNNPTPYTDGNCPDEEYRYLSNSPQSYSVISCIGSSQGNLIAGGVSVTNNSGLQSIGATNGLVLYLDASNPASYPGFGNTWYDLSGSNNHGTLIDGPIFNSDNGGSIVFDGVNDYINLSNQIQFDRTDAFTLSSWVLVKSTNSQIINNENGSYRGYQFAISSNGNLTFFFRNTVNTNFIGVRDVDISELNKFLFVSVSYDGSSDASGVKLYINSILKDNVVVGNNLTDTTISNETTWMGKRRPATQGSLNGNIYQTSIYNRELTASEILQNYNATKDRFVL